MSIGTFNSENLMGYAQSAGNLSFLSFPLLVKEVKSDIITDKSPSETTRETSFNFHAYRNISKNDSYKITDVWLTWFIGFSEGDGAFLREKNTRGRFVLTQKETAILNHIQETLGIGRVRHFPHFSRYLVDDKKSIDILIALFNGNLVLNKRKLQFKKWLDMFNYPEMDNNALPLVTNAWLSGFIDAEGCFNVTLFKRKAMLLGYQVKLRFMIDQKDSLDNMLFIKDQLKLFLTHRKLKKGSVGLMHRVETTSFVKVPFIIQYINKFNLKTKKQQSFDKWVTVYDMVNNKAHLTETGLNDIRRLSKQVNLLTSITNKTGNMIK